MSQDTPKATPGRVIDAVKALQAKIQPLMLPSRVAIIPPSASTQLLQLGALLKTAESIIAQAHEEGHRIQAHARQKGYQEGLAEASGVLLKARGEYNALMERAEADLVSLSLELTRKIVGHRLEAQPELIADLVAKTVELARGRRRVEIHVHPSHLAQVKAATARFKDITGSAQVYAVEDEGVPRGGSRIETEAGVIEADLDTQLEVLAEALGVPLWDHDEESRRD